MMRALLALAVAWAAAEIVEHLTRPREFEEMMRGEARRDREWHDTMAGLNEDMGKGRVHD